MFKEEVIENGLLISAILFVGGVLLLLRHGTNYFGWWTLSNSFGLLAAYSSRKLSGKRQKTLLNILSWAVPSIGFIYGFVFNLF